MSPHAELPNGLLRSFAHTLKEMDVITMTVYVVLSLAGALTGSLAAVSLVPLIQPEHSLPIAGGLLDMHRSVAWHAMVFALATTAFALLRWQASRLGARLASRYSMNLRRLVHARLIDASLLSLADSTSAEIANVLTYNVEIITQGFNAWLQLLVAAMTCVVSLAFAFWVSPPLVLAAPLFAIFGLLASRVSGREQSAVSRQYVQDLTRLFWLSEDFPRRVRHVRSFERERVEKESYGAISARLGHGYQRQLELIASGRLILELLAAAGIAAVLLLAYRLHGVNQSSLIAVCLLFGRLLPYLISTRQSFQQLRSASPAFELWQRYMRLDLSLSLSPVAAPRGLGVDQTLHIERVYLKAPLTGLEINHLHLVPGQLTLICGDSGIGKSSLVDVLAGMMEPMSFVANAERRSMDFDEYRRLIRKSAYVSQSVRPWQHSIRECLLWAAPEASDQMLQSVLKSVGLDKRLGSSQRELETSLNDPPHRLSGGELQRLLLAQVILRQPYLALLDEATSALDVTAEVGVLSELKRRLPQTILIVVSHRSGVAALADQCLIIGGDLRVTIEKACAQVEVSA